MIELPEWDSQFVIRAKRYTMRRHLYDVGRTMILWAIPWGLALATSLGFFSQGQSFAIILWFFCATFGFFVMDQILRDPMLRRRRRLIFRLLGTLPELMLLCLLTMYWWLVFPGHIALAIGAWWVGGIGLVMGRYLVRTWALREAILQTKDYKLFAHKTGRFSKRIKHGRASLYELPDNSVFSQYAVMVLARDEPEVYVGAGARRLLNPDELRAAIAHELGHSWSQRYVGHELVDWLRRLLFIPILVAAGSTLLANAPLWMERNLIFALLTMMTLAWQINHWVSCLLGRPRELAADLHAIEMTRTPQAYVAGMRKLVETEPYNVFPNLFDALGLCSHPCLVKRVNNLATAAKRLGDSQ
jgi:Zn-dependent protease with chaperone function